MTIHDWLQTALLVVMTIFSVGRWAQARVDRDDTDDQTFREYCRTHAAEHVRVDNEIQRNRDHWHRELVPQLQRIVGDIAGLQGGQANNASEITRIWKILDDDRPRRREPR